MRLGPEVAERLPMTGAPRHPCGAEPADLCGVGVSSLSYAWPRADRGAVLGAVAPGFSDG